jgi:hypothetical protein
VSEEKTERLGVRGTLALFESALRLLGAANATGLLASGAAYQAFGKYSDLKTMAMVFLAGVFAFGVGYAFWFGINFDRDHALQTPEEDARLNSLFPGLKNKGAEHSLRSAKHGAVVMYTAGLVSLICFAFGLLTLVRLAVRL